MGGEVDFIVSKPAVGESLVLPDGTRPLPLGSGSIAGLLGVGGMSNVYKIWCPQLERHRAVKLMKPDISAEARRRFQTEIKITAALSHPNIIEIHSVGEWHNLSFIEMEFIEGATLAEIIAQKGALPIHVCTALGILIARALTYAHAKEYVLYGKTYHGLIHRDLKTSNIMIAGDGRVKLMDFGIARPVETSLMTLDGAVMGTMQYLAPEQIDGEKVGVAADIYALGAIIYEMLTGRKAFPQINLSQLMSAKTENNFIPLRMFKIRIPRRLKNLAGKCMQKDQEKRPSTSADLLRELESIHRTVSPETPENVVTGFIQSIGEKPLTMYALRRRLPAIKIAAALLLGIAGGTGIAFMYFNKSHSVRPQPRAPLPVTAEKATAPAPAVPANTVQAPVPLPRAPKTAQKSGPPEKTAVTKQNTFPDAAAAAPKSQLDKIKESTGIADPVEILIRESNLGRYASVLQVYDELPPSITSDPIARLLRLRALIALNRAGDVAVFFQRESIEDGEFYLLKARYLLDKGDIDGAMPALDKSSTVSARHRDAKFMRRDYLYYRAVALGRRYEQSPTDENRKNALDGWFEVKNSLRENPDHAYFRKAVMEMQKIGAGTKQAKG